MVQLNLAKLYMNKSIFKKKYPILREPKQTQTWRMIRKQIQNVIELSRALYMEKTPTLQQHEVLYCPTLQLEPHGGEIRHNQTWLDYHSLYNLHLVQLGLPVVSLIPQKRVYTWGPLLCTSTAVLSGCQIVCYGAVVCSPLTLRSDSVWWSE